MPRKKKTEEEQKQEQSLEEVPRTKEQFRLALRRKTRMYYDIQMMRLQAEGRLTKKAKTNPIELHPADKAKLGGRVSDLQVAEDNALVDLDEHLQQVPFYQEVILPQRKGLYRGFGPRLASIIVSSFDIEREEMPSQMWSFAGLAPEKAQRCKHCSVVLKDSEHTDGVHAYYFHPKPQGNKCKFVGQDIVELETFSSGKTAKPKPGEKLKYNAWLRTKLMGVMAEVLIKLGSRYFTCNHCGERVKEGENGFFEHKAKKDKDDKVPPLDCLGGHNNTSSQATRAVGLER